MRSIIFKIARNGKTIVSINNKFIQSRFDPEKEAKRFIDTIKIDQNESNYKDKIAIIFGESCGYLLEELSTYSFSKIIILITNKIFFELLDKKVVNMEKKNNCKIKLCYVNNEKELIEKLPYLINSSEIKDIKNFYWKPYLDIDQKMKEYHEKTFPIWLKRKVSSINTELYFGKKWFFNSIINYIRPINYLSIEKSSYPIVITAAGSNLPKSIKLLKKERKKYILIALSASVKALNSAQIRPDIIIQTDPGYWSSQITNRAVKYYENKTDSPIIMMPLNAAPIKSKIEKRILINYNTILDQQFYSENATTISIPETGSAACTALQVGLKITTNKVYFAGLDLEEEKELHHLISHLSIEWKNREVKKTSSLQTTLFQKYSSKKSRALSIFKEWFNQQHKENNNFLRIEPVISTEPQNSISQNKFIEILKKKSEIDFNNLLTTIEYNQNHFKIASSFLDNLKTSITKEGELFKKIAENYPPLIYNEKNKDLISKELLLWIEKSEKILEASKFDNN